ncbi:2Fe-2S iron-sulfur cluster-binding protein [Metallumcola ferriviriculae]|uniref:succinate dehydrogenase n=1 Tax=Metallumcola ferriviriculae TaxID=3039180 RepID=A0AAU0ULA3_9FIRM|nr:2Fe-2S iron-sulfur cluster-binding protein [Desulfitibacteraceae bacterium MK1]
MSKLKLSIVRGTNANQVSQEYFVADSCETVLDALQYIYRYKDSTLSFRYDCRFKRCGLCGVSVDGRPVLACTTQVKDGMEIGPLPGLPVVRDLVVDRSFLDKLYQDLDLMIIPGAKNDEPPGCMVSSDYFHFAQCNECLVCATVCPAGQGEGKVFGPFVWVRLAQLHLDPRDRIDRIAQAERLGVNGCAGCGKCHCASGIDFKKALGILKKDS